MLRSSTKAVNRCNAFSRPLRSFSSVSWAAGLDPFAMSASNPAKLKNLVAGKWVTAEKTQLIPDPLNGEPFIEVPDTSEDELKPFIESLESVPKSGLHNPFKNPERYVMYGKISARMAEAFNDPDVHELFTKAIQRTSPKSRIQAQGEVNITQDFLHTFSGDSVRFLACSPQISGDRLGQSAHGYRWPFGPVALVTPFNFPLEIPALQLMGALYMGNKPVVKGADMTSMVSELFVRLLIECGMPATDLDLIHCHGLVMNKLINRAPIRVTQFTGSSRVAEKLSLDTHGKVKVEDAGFDWKILGPDVQDVDFVAWQCDSDAYASTGQKCSAQSLIFMHENWEKAGLVERLKVLASKRKLDDLTIAPLLSHTTEQVFAHRDKLLSIPGAKVLFGGKELENHSIPKIYAAVEPTAIYVPIEEMMKDSNFDLCCTEIFGPFQVVTSYKHEQLPLVLKATERMEQHLTAAVVSNDIRFIQNILGNTVNGTTYAGMLARTTGAPPWHWFGPCGDPRGAGIGTPDAIRHVWSHHREIIYDHGPPPAELPPQS